MNSISEDTPRIFRTDDGDLLSPVAPVLAISVEKSSFRSKTTPIGEYRDYLGVADIKQQLAAQVNENKIKYDLAQTIFKPIITPVGSPEWKAEYSAQTAAYAEALNDTALMWGDQPPAFAALAYTLPTPIVPQEVWDHMAAQKKTAEEASGVPPAPPALVNKPKVALGEKLKKIIALNSHKGSEKKSTAKLDIDKWVSLIDGIAEKNNMSTSPYKPHPDLF